MNVEDFARGLTRDPDFLWQDIDLINRRGLVVKLDEATYRRASFLDNRAFTRDTNGAWLPLARILQEAAGSPAAPAPHGIFHVSHCGSTLVSRLLAELSGCLPIREPLVPLGLAMERRELERPLARLDGSSWDALFDATMGSLSRVYRSGDRSVIKYTSAGGNLLAPFLERMPESKALLLHTDLETWLAVMLRDDDVRLNGRFYAQAWLSDLHALTGRRDLRLSALNDAQQFAINWLTAMLHFERANDQFGARVRRCNFEDFLIDPRAGLEGVGGFLGFDITKVGEVAAGPLLKSYAKNPAKPFDRATRDQELKQARERLSVEISAGMKFAERLCDEIEMLAPLAIYLTRSNTRKE